MKPGRLFAAILSLVLTAAAPASPQLLPLAATTVAGQTLRLDASRHNVVIVHFWATWCAPCRVEMPILDAIHRRYQGAGAVVIGIALDAGASRSKIAQAAMGANFPLARLSDTNVRPRDVPGALPETLVFGRDGRLRQVFSAGGTMLDAAALERIVPPLLAER